jgi:uncharacterized membrane protein YkvA (DUF1232 family)
MNGLMARARRAAAFLADPRVPKLPRFAVLAAVGYLLWPVDFLPDFLIPLGGFVDDAAVLWMSLRWLVRSGDAATVVSTDKPELPR